LLLVHVIADSARGVPLYLRDQFYRESEDGARAQMQKLARKHRLDAKMHRAVYLWARDPAKAIVGQAKKSRVFMIVMGSRGLRALKRLVLGSVAERTLRYARCPVLIVKG
jgi:nucleotide-binding universal stress UspA family protein